MIRLRRRGGGKGGAAPRRPPRGAVAVDEEQRRRLIECCAFFHAQKFREAGPGNYRDEDLRAAAGEIDAVIRTVRRKKRT